MRWEDERYVRIYTRDTPDWLCLSFLAQGLFCLILRKVDRAGLLKLGKHGKKAVAIVVGFPGDWPRLEPALEELIEDGCVQIKGEFLLVPNFIEAQEAPQSDAQRKRESRARSRDIAAAAAVLNPDKASGSVTSGHDSGQKVTPSPVASQVVTPNCAVPSRTRNTSSSAAPDPAAEKWPLVAAVLAALLDRGFECFWPSDEKTAAKAEQAIRTVGIPEAVSRVMAGVEDARARKVEPPAYLGWHVDAIAGRRLKPRQTKGDLGADLEPWYTRLTPEERQAVRGELVALAPDLAEMPIGVTGDPTIHPVEAIRAVNDKWRAVVEART
jgi:hypothetical protein